jgi:steroid 5-alpha reductase family enzyme
VITRAAGGWILSAAVMALLWAWQRRSHNAGVVNVGWTALIAALTLLDARVGEGDVYRRAAIASMMGSWGLRLSVYLLYDRVLGKPEDGRYAAMRQAWGDAAERRFFWLFQYQACVALFFSLPALIASDNPAPELSPIELAAAGLWVVAFAGESTADRQLLRFKTDPANSGRTCGRGLWRYSRHPNYFFEWLMWVAYALFAIGSPWGWSALLCPAAMLYILFRVTGIGVTEAHAVRWRGDEYRRYQASTSPFVPWFPKES